MNKILYIANWKMNKSFNDSESFINKLLLNLDSTDNNEVVICPSFISLAKLDSTNRFK